MNRRVELANNPTVALLVPQVGSRCGIEKIGVEVLEIVCRLIEGVDFSLLFLLLLRRRPGRIICGPIFAARHLRPKLKNVTFIYNIAKI